MSDLFRGKISNRKKSAIWTLDAIARLKLENSVTAEMVFSGYFEPSSCFLNVIHGGANISTGNFKT